MGGIGGIGMLALEIATEGLNEARERLFVLSLRTKLPIVDPVGDLGDIGSSSSAIAGGTGGRTFPMGGDLDRVCLVAVIPWPLMEDERGANGENAAWEGSGDGVGGSVTE
jgi:hypothetical protein